MKQFLMIAALLTLSLAACKKDKKDTVTTPAPVNEQELITTFRIQFTDAAGLQPTVTAEFADLDGPGGNAPTSFDTIVLQANTTYNASITLLNESVSPVEDITLEVHEEAQDHLFCFDPASGLNVSITRTDSDGTYQVGIVSQWITTAVSSGQVTIRLKHQPGVKDGSCEPGETDIELTFQVEIQ